MKFTYFKLFSILNVILLLSSCKTNVVNTEIATVTPKPGSSFTYSIVSYDSNGVETGRETETDTVVSSLDTFNGKSNIISIVNITKLGGDDPKIYSYELNGDISLYVDSKTSSSSWCTYPVSTQKESTFLLAEFKDMDNSTKTLRKFLPGADLDIKVGNETFSTKQISWTQSQEKYSNNQLVNTLIILDNNWYFSKKIGYIVRDVTIDIAKNKSVRTLISYSLK